MAIPIVLVLSGWPRSGKSSIARFLEADHGFIRVCSDDLREEYGMVWGTTDRREAMVNHVVHHRALEAVMMARNVVIDTTAMFRSQRSLFFDLNVYAQGKLLAMQARKWLVSLDISEAEWERRQQAAGRSQQQNAFYLEKFQPVEADELATVECHLSFSNNTAAELAYIKQQLSHRLALPAPHPPD